MKPSFIEFLAPAYLANPSNTFLQKVFNSTSDNLADKCASDRQTLDSYNEYNSIYLRYPYHGSFQALANKFLDNFSKAAFTDICNSSEERNCLRDLFNTAGDNPKQYKDLEQSKLPQYIALPNVEIFYSLTLADYFDECDKKNRDLNSKYGFEIPVLSSSEFIRYNPNENPSKARITYTRIYPTLFTNYQRTEKANALLGTEQSILDKELENKGITFVDYMGSQLEHSDYSDESCHMLMQVADMRARMEYLPNTLNDYYRKVLQKYQSSLRVSDEEIEAARKSELKENNIAVVDGNSGNDKTGVVSTEEEARKKPFKTIGHALDARELETKSLKVIVTRIAQDGCATLPKVETTPPMPMVKPPKPASKTDDELMAAAKVVTQKLIEEAINIHNSNNGHHFERNEILNTLTLTYSTLKAN